MKICKKVKISPTKSQIELFDFWFRRCKRLYNVALDEKKFFYQATGKYLSLYEQKKELVGLKKDDPSWGDVPNKCLQEIIFRVDKAFVGFFGGNGYPKYKNDDTLKSIEFVEKDVRVKNGLVFLPKIKNGICGVEPFPEKYSTVKLKREGTNFFLCFTIEEKETVSTKLESPTVVGGDLGLKTLLTDSNGVEVKRFSKKMIGRYEQRIKELNLSLSKKKKGSIRRQKVKKQLQKAHSRLKNTRLDYLQKESTTYIKKTKENVIVFGNLQVKDLMESDGTKRQQNFSRSYSQTAISIFSKQVEYKAKKYNKEFHFANEEFTSKTCSCCGMVKHDLKVSDRIYHCTNCDKSIPRDLNAAINIKNVHLGTFHPIGIDLEGSIKRHQENKVKKLLGSNNRTKNAIRSVISTEYI